MSTVAVQPAFDNLKETDVAAGTAREAWLRDAFKRGGKQIPSASPHWSQTIFRAGRGFGKALSIDTPIPTPTGWTTMGELCAGDQVFDEDGEICTVIDVWPVMQGRPCFRVRFSDGEEIIADEDHLWLTWDKQARKAHGRAAHPQSGPRVRTTAQIKATLFVGRRDETNHSIPCAKPLTLPHADLPVDPYVLGAWLGDGTSAGSVIVVAEDGMREQLERAGAILVPNKVQPGKTPLFGVPMLGGPFLRVSGLLRNKHIPPAYLRASYAQRLALLQGLMDTDGHAHDKNGTCEFTNTNERLARDTLELIRTLGLKPTMTVGRAMLYGKDCGPKYRIHFTAYFPVFRLARKAGRQIVARTQSLRQTQRYVVGVEPIGSVPVRCITVDSPSSLYLAGRGMIPTHNTRAIVEWAWWEAWSAPNLIGHAVGPTKDDVKKVLMLGPAGFRSCVPAECLAGGSWDTAYNKTDHELYFANGSRILGFGAADQGARLRGPQCHFAIGDELREWDRPKGNLEYVHNNMMLGVRLPYPDGRPARACFGTTPKAIPYLRNLYQRRDVEVVTGTTYENLRNLSAAFASTILSLEGTNIGKAEIHGLDTDIEEGGIFKRSWFRLWPPGKKLPEFEFILFSMDTAFEDENYDEKTQTSDFSAGVVLGVFNTKQCFSEAELKRMGVKSKYAAVVCDLFNERLGFPELLEKARKLYRTKWGQPGRYPDLVLIENKASGISLRQSLKSWGIPTWPFNPYNESKTMRAHAASPYVLQGHIFVPESALLERKGLVRDWCEPLLEQLCSFAGEGSIKYDDIVDCLVQAVLYLASKGLFLAEPMGRALPDPDEEDERKMAEAVAIAEKQKRANAGNPYD